MKTLIVEDDFASRMILQRFLNEYGLPDIAVNGKEAIEAARQALEAGEPYDLICLDIMMPDVDGLQALKVIRNLEKSKGIMPSNGAKIIMRTAVADGATVLEAVVRGKCDYYLTKPIQKSKLIEELRKLKLIA
jgi:two-component system chemotaxis response regulator CheY